MDFIFDPDSADPAIFDGGPCGCKPRDFDAVPVGSIPCAAAASFPLIPRSEWSARIRDMEERKARLSDLMEFEEVPCLNQEQLSFCHGFSPCEAIMALRATQGQPFKLLSASSIAAPVTGFRDAGAFIHDDLEQISKVGCASVEFVPMLQVSEDGFRDGWEADAAKYRVTEWWDLGQRDGTMFDRVATLLLSHIPVCSAANWWGHAFTLVDLVETSPGQFGVRFRNSWGPNWPQAGADGYAILNESKGTPDEAYAPRSIVVSA